MVGIGLFLALTLPGLCDSNTEGLPKAQDQQRYAALRMNSPFSLAATETVSATVQASFAANWYIGGIGRIGDAAFVTVRSRDLSTQFSLFAHEPDAKTQVTLESVEWSDVVGKSTVVLRKGNEVARLEFNEAVIRSAPVSVAGAPVTTASGNTAGAPPVPAGIPPRGTTPGVVPQKFPTVYARAR